MSRPTRKLLSVYGLRLAAAIGLAATVAACSGGASTQENPITEAPPTVDYNGLPAATADIQAFRVNLWEFIRPNNRCGGCHNATGQAPQFARSDDVNKAYTAVGPIVNLAQPDQSRMVLKVAGGHNCWLQSPQACADTITVWIRNWAGDAATGGRQIQLKAPPIKEVGQSKSFPADSSLFSTTVWPLLRTNCAGCHVSSSPTAQRPFFASSDVDEAYAAARDKMNLDNPSQSRFVLRLRDEFHNCWDTDGDGAPECNRPDGNPPVDNDSADFMETAIQNFSNGVPLNQVDPSLVISKALTLYDGTVAAGGNRFDNNVIALWEFKAENVQTDRVAFDTSGVEPGLHLDLLGDTSFVGGWGVAIRPGGSVRGTTAGSRKLAEMIKSTGEFSIELWAAPANVVQEDAYILSYSGGPTDRNVTIAQRAYQYEAMVRSDRTDNNGSPLLITNADDEDAQATLQHIVLTYDPVNGRRLYVNGVFTGDVDGQGGGSLADWDDSFVLLLGNETSNNRQWQGVIRLVAVHNRALTLSQIQQNFAVGVGERYFLLFSVSHLVNVPQSYLMLEGSQMDSYSYLFNKPTFISLDPNARPDNIAIKGLRIGVNGAESRVGQAYIPLNATVTSSGYTPQGGQMLASVGTVIGLEKGPMQDEFFVSFEQIGSNTHAYVEAPPPAPEQPADAPAQPEFGLRTFDKMNASMSDITRVPVTNPGVAQTFNQIRQSLPAIETLNTFVASHQSAITQLAVEYCNALVEDAGLRASFFPGLDLNTSADTTANRNAIINPLLARVVGQNLVNQPIDQDVTDRVNELITRLAATGGVGRTATVTKAACATVLGSAALTLH